MTTLPEQLVAHLREWVGAWPPTCPPTVVANPRAAMPAWDGRIRPVRGVIDPAGRSVIGLPPDVADRVGPPADGADLDGLLARLPGLFGQPGGRVYRAVYRWSIDPTPLPDAGVWLAYDDPRVPGWLHPFGGDVLVVLDGDRYLAGVGIKRHDEHVRELAVVTDEAARGRGLARRLVAQAARRVLAEGAVPTYLHAPTNTASARVAAAAGFPDLGWRALGLADG